MSVIKDNINEILAGIAGGFVFVVFFIILNIGIIFSAIAGIAAFAAVLLIMKKKSDQSVEMMSSGVTAEQLKTVLKYGNDKIAELKKESSKISNPDVVKKVNDIIHVVNKIFKNFEKDPKDIKTARQFLAYYLDSTIKIVTKYAELSGNHPLSEEVKATMQKSENLLEKIRVAFEKQLNILLRDDLMDLDTEISLLENTLKSEGLD